LKPSNRFNTQQHGANSSRAAKLWKMRREKPPLL
jgi:hypothetical protein